MFKLLKDKSIKAGILSSLIATILFLYLIEPIGNFLAKLLLYIGGILSSTFIDGLYSDMANGKTDYALSVFMIFIFLIIFTLITVISVNFRTIRGKINSISNAKNEDEVKFKEKKSAWIGLISSTILLFIFLFVSVMAIIKIQTINNFEQRIRILKPYFTLQKIEIIESDFARMKSKEEFEVIYQQLDSLSQSIDIELPNISYSNLY